MSIAVLLFPNVTLAYLDPGTGSLLFQFLLAAFVGVSFAVKVYWQKLRLFVTNVFSRSKKEEEENERDGL